MCQVSPLAQIGSFELLLIGSTSNKKIDHFIGKIKLVNFLFLFLNYYYFIRNRPSVFKHPSIHLSILCVW